MINRQFPGLEESKKGRGKHMGTEYDYQGLAPSLAALSDAPTTEPTLRNVPSGRRRLRNMESMPDEHSTQIENLHEQVHTLVDNMDWVKEGIRTILQKLEDESAWDKPPDNYDMTASQIKDLILEEVGLDKPFYPSDLAMEYGLDLDAVYEAVNILRAEGRVIDRN